MAVSSHDRKVKETKKTWRITERSAVKDHTKHLEQISGFRNCLDIWFNKNFKSVSWTPTTDFGPKLKNLDLNQLPKWFKFTLANTFSIWEEQEKPENPFDFEIPFMDLFNRRSQNYLRSFLRTTKNSQRSKFHRISWDLLQCKTQSHEVPKSFIKEAYEKHHKTMSKTSDVIPNDLLEEFREFIQPFISETKRCFSTKTSYPTNHSCFSHSRSQGGIRGALEPLFIDRTYYKDYQGQRIDPVIIHLEGGPKQGKSYMIEQLCVEIGKYFGLCSRDFRSFTYYRSAAVKHWDGYRNQLITVIDDIGFETPDKTKVPESISELIQLCSDCDYTVPMADLRDKGKKFTSKFLILTSNSLNTKLHYQSFSCPSAFMRRTSPTYHFNPVVVNHKEKPKVTIAGYEFLPTEVDPTTGLQLTPYTNQVSCFSHWKKFSDNESVSSIVERAMEDFKTKTLKFDPSVRNLQVISEPDGSTPGMALDWNKSESLGPNFVKTHAIPEPLKVRMITKPQACAYALKPVQKAMFKSLEQFKCFEPCWNPDYTVDFKPSADKYLLSGDYTSATDDLNFNISQVAIQELEKVFQSQRFYSDLIQWEGGSHMVVYPKWTGLDPVLQENGQLMGSLLSFPILCWVNAFTICKATHKSLKDVEALFHGDDVAALVTQEEYLKWKAIAAQVGLSLSVGKNYLSKEFVSIDSQLFVHKDDQMVKLKTGKYRLVQRTDDNEMTVTSALKAGFTKDLIRKYNSQQLTKSIRSLDVALELGGLGLETNSDHCFSLSDKLVNFVKDKRNFEVNSLGNNLFRINRGVARFLKLKPINLGIDPDKQVSEDRLKKTVQRLTYRYHHDRSFKYDIDNYVMKDLTKASQKTVVRCVNVFWDDLQQVSDSFRGVSPFNRQTLVKVQNCTNYQQSMIRSPFIGRLSQ